MEGIGGKNGKPASSSSSISNQLFGPKGGSNSVSPSSKPNSSTGIFDSVFSHPSTYSRSEVVGSWRKNDSENQGWSSNQQNQNGGNASQTSEGQGQSQSGYNKGRSSIFQDHKAEPHYLSSSLYYGGQDVYSNSSDTHTRSSVKPQTYKEDGEDDDPHGSNLHSASRGNWWQGGLYY